MRAESPLFHLPNLNLFTEPVISAGGQVEPDVQNYRIAVISNGLTANNTMSIVTVVVRKNFVFEQDGKSYYFDAETGALATKSQDEFSTVTYQGNRRFFIWKPALQKR